jgi:hypothetical protein
VCDVAVAALATVDDISVASKMPTLALERGEPNAEQQGQLTGPGTIGPALIEDRSGVLAIVLLHQSSLSSPQKA